MVSKSSVYINMRNAQNDSENAIQWARDQLLSKGFAYPTKRPNQAIVDYYDAIKEYGEKEAALVRDYFKARAPVVEPSLPKAKKLRLVPAKPIAMPYYDD